jgi:hypothetical protein
MARNSLASSRNSFSQIQLRDLHGRDAGSLFHRLIGQSYEVSVPDVDGHLVYCWSRWT